MASTWPKATIWLSDLREYTTYLSKYLRDTLLYIESAKEQPIPTLLIKTIITTISIILSKIKTAPDYNTVIQTLILIQNNVKTIVEII